ncbi:MAG: polysaccharide biosynthesis/export family protein [Ginsengibacter sp.]
MFWKNKFPVLVLFAGLFLIFLSSCVDTKKVTYFNDVQDSARLISSSSLEPIIQKKDILSILVSSLSEEATVVFNAPNIPVVPSSSANPNVPQTAGYLVNGDGNIKFPVLGNIRAAGLTQKQLEDTITYLLIYKKLLYDPIVTSRFLNFRVTVLGEVNRPGVITVPSEQISILEAIGQAGDLTIYGLRDHVMLIRQVGKDKIIKRLDLNSSRLLQSPYYFLKSNDVIYVEPGVAKAASSSLVQQRLPVILSGLSLLIILLTNVFKL